MELVKTLALLALYPTPLAAPVIYFVNVDIPGSQRFAVVKDTTVAYYRYQGDAVRAIKSWNQGAVLLFFPRERRLDEVEVSTRRRIRSQDLSKVIQLDRDNTVALASGPSGIMYFIGSDTKTIHALTTGMSHRVIIKGSDLLRQIKVRPTKFSDPRDGTRISVAPSGKLLAFSVNTGKVVSSSGKHETLTVIFDMVSRKAKVVGIGAPAGWLSSGNLVTWSASKATGTLTIYDKRGRKVGSMNNVATCATHDDSIYLVKGDAGYLKTPKIEQWSADLRRHISSEMLAVPFHTMDNLNLIVVSPGSEP